MFVTASQEQAVAALRAATVLVDAPSAEPVVADLSGVGRTLVAAASQLYFSPAVTVDPDDLTPITPQELARVIGADRSLAEHVASLLAVASLADGRFDTGRLLLVVEFAHHLGVHEGWVRDMHEVARGHLAWAMADMVRRNAATFPGFRDEHDRAPNMYPYESQTDQDKKLADSFEALVELPGNTFGRAFYEHFCSHGFGLPGQVGAFNGQFAVPHDSLHVLSGYSTSPQGEILVSTFTGGMHRQDNMRAHLLPVIIEWHVGSEVNGIGAHRGNLDPEKFLVAWDRGQTISRDVLAPDWNFWTWTDRDLMELRESLAIPDLLPKYAATGPEATGR